MLGKKWAVALGAIGLVAAVLSLPRTAAQNFEGDLTAPSGGAPFGGSVVGSFEIEVDGNTIEIEAEVFLSGSTLEGWLVDTQTGYKLSLGALNGDSLEFEQSMVNPFTYGVLVITAEPAGDLNPNPAAPVAGAMLPAPFGQ